MFSLCAAAFAARLRQGFTMKKQQPVRGFWDWVMGNGWGGAGAKG